MNTYDILIRPIITEKTLDDAKKLNEFTFEVKPSVTKFQIKKAVEEVFGVKVLMVRKTKLAGESRRFGARFKRRIPDVTKAIVKLEAGQKIDLFEVEEKKLAKG